MPDPSSNHEPQAMSNVQETLRDQVTKNRVVLYMKGTPQFPQCGFSATVAEILKRCGVDDYFSVNVLADAEIRQGIKDFANWPTIPQLYVDGEFIGGCDIVREMYASGELQKVLSPQTA
jgi:monothiol glutaredoxin